MKTKTWIVTGIGSVTLLGGSAYKFESWLNRVEAEKQAQRSQERGQYLLLADKLGIDEGFRRFYGEERVLTALKGLLNSPIQPVIISGVARERVSFAIKNSDDVARQDEIIDGILERVLGKKIDAFTSIGIEMNAHGKAAYHMENWRQETGIDLPGPRHDFDTNGKRCWADVNLDPGVLQDFRNEISAKLKSQPQLGR